MHNYKVYRFASSLRPDPKCGARELPVHFLHIVGIELQDQHSGLLRPADFRQNSDLLIRPNFVAGERPTVIAVGGENELVVLVAGDIYFRVKMKTDGYPGLEPALTG